MGDTEPYINIKNIKISKMCHVCIYIYMYISILYTYHIYIHKGIFVLYNLFPTVIDPPTHVLKNQQVPHADWWSDWYDLLQFFLHQKLCWWFTLQSVGEVATFVSSYPVTTFIVGDSPLPDFESEYFPQDLTTNSVLAVSTWLVSFSKGFLCPFSTKKYQQGLGSYRSAQCWIPSNASSPGGPGT